MVMRRLMKDLQEVKESPLFNVVGGPEPENLFKWHVNIRSSEGDDELQANPLAGAVFHLILEFNEYVFPEEGPQVYLCTPLPHPNVAPQLWGPQMNGWPVELWNCTPGYKGWSSAYSVQSVLLQLQTFLLQEDLLYDVRNVSMLQAMERARDFVCEGCGHSGTNPVPAFLTPEEIEDTIRNRQKKLITNPNRSRPMSQPVVYRADEPQHDEWQIVTSKKSRAPMKVWSADQVRSVDEERSADQERSSNLKGRNSNTESIEEAMGYFGPLPQEALTTIMRMLSTEALSSLARTCRGLKVASEDGYLWKLLLHRHFPTTSLTAESMGDWKRVFSLQQNNILESLRCFYTKCTFEEEVLGFPLSFTVNPKTHEVDYISFHFDILSEAAYSSGLRRTADNQKFELLLPLYITRDHFERALPRIQATIAQLCGHGAVFQPDMVLDVMPKVLNTMVVLLCDKGVRASERAIEGYCMMHRLFLALCERFNLWNRAEQEVIKFRNSPRAQTKEQCPDLGRLMARLSVCSSEDTAWKEVVRPLTSEVFDRSVIWICKHDPSVASNYEQASNESSSVDEKLLRSAWDGSRIGLRLNMFHVGFLHLLARPTGTSRKKVTAGYDALYGMPSSYLKKRIQEFIKRVVTTGYDWPFFFRIMGMECPTKLYLTKWLGQCWQNSLLKGYHTRNTKFKQIQRRGVSTILSKGESCTVNLNTATMLESWRWRGDHVKFLDASCLLFDVHGAFLDVVDWCHVRSRGKAITHSGDIIDNEMRQGNHRIQINLLRLSMYIKELYFTMSGWNGATLRDFRLPFVQLKDDKTGAELCEYSLEDKSLASYTSVIMCRMYRSEAPDSKWKVQALGQLGQGSANDYGPLIDSITALINARSGPSGTRN
jgi:stress response protein SCP2/ubiquitin-protein ligase